MATVAGWQQRIVEGWTEISDHQFSSIVVRSEIGDNVSVWTEIRVGMVRETITAPAEGEQLSRADACYSCQLAPS